MPSLIRSAERGSSNRLGIAFLLTCTFCTALSLAIDVWDLQLAEDVTPQEQTYWRAYSLCFRPLNGVCLAFGLLTVARIWRRIGPPPRAPGHYYLLAMAALLLLLRGEDVVRLAVSNKSLTWTIDWRLQAWRTFAYGASILIAVIGASVPRQNSCWRLVLVLHALILAVTVADIWDFEWIGKWTPAELRMDTLQGIFSFVAVLASLAALGQDRIAAYRRDGYHWLGVFILWMTACFGWAFATWHQSIYG